MGVRFPSPTLMSNENILYIISETGFGGKAFRGINRFMREIPTDPKSTILIPTESKKRDNLKISIRGKKSSKGKLVKIFVRPKENPSSPKLKLSLFQPANPTAFDQYAQSQKLEFAKTPLSPSDYAISRMLTAIAKADRSFDAVGNFKEKLFRYSNYPPQNLDKIPERIISARLENRPFEFACFVCLNSSIVNIGGEARDRFSSSIENSRILVPRIYQRIEEFILALQLSGVDFRLNFLIADTDANDIYGKYLADSKDIVEKQIQEYIENITPKLKRLPGKIQIIRWSTIQPSSDPQYISDFQKVYANVASLVGQEVIDRSVNRRKKYFAQKGFLNETLELSERWIDAAKRNVALYGAQGRELIRKFGMLIIIDPDPLILAKNQSILVKDDLSISYL